MIITQYLLRERPNRAGFTLIELLVVVSIIGLLSTIVTLSVQDARIKARDAKRLADIHQIQIALEFFALDNGGRYAAGSNLVLGRGAASCFNITGFQPPGCSRPYMARVPADPYQHNYIYSQLDNGNSYQISFVLESSVSNLSAGNHLATPEGFQ